MVTIRWAGILWLLFGTSALHAQVEMRLEAGAAIVNVTPPLGELVVGGFTPLPADDVHDELHVRTIVLTERPAGSASAIGSGQELDPERTIAITVCDNVGIAREVFDTAQADDPKRAWYLAKSYVNGGDAYSLGNQRALD